MENAEIKIEDNRGVEIKEEVTMKPFISEEGPQSIESAPKVTITHEELTKEDEALIDKAMQEVGLAPKENTDGEENKKLDLTESVDAYDNIVDHMTNLVMKKDTNEDSACLWEIFQEMKKNRGVIKGSAFNRLTPSLKEEMRKSAVMNGCYKMQDVQMYAKTTITQMYQDLTIDKEWAKLQEDIKKASRMPEQMDIFGEVIYDKMVKSSLLKVAALKAKGRDDYNIYEKVADIYLNHYFFIDMMDAVYNNQSYICKTQKNYKRAIDDIKYIFDKIGIKNSAATDPWNIYRIMVKRYDIAFANEFMCGLYLVLEKIQSETDNVKKQETCFILSQFMGVVAFINKDKEVRTDFGRKLMDNLERYNKVVMAIKTGADNNIDETVTSIIKEALLDKQELYNKAVEEATKKIAEDNLTSNVNTEETLEAPTPSEENQAPEVAHAE